MSKAEEEYYNRTRKSSYKIAFYAGLAMLVLIIILVFTSFTTKQPIGWRFHYVDVAREHYYPKDFVDREVLRHHPDNYLTFWKVRGEKDWDRVTRIYKK